jgi:hypothetical protein
VSALLQSLKTRLARLADDIGRRLRQSFFLYLAAVFTLIAIVDASTANYFGGCASPPSTPCCACV